MKSHYFIFSFKSQLRAKDCYFLNVMQYPRIKHVFNIRRCQASDECGRFTGAAREIDRQSTVLPFTVRFDGTGVVFLLY